MVSYKLSIICKTKSQLQIGNAGTTYQLNERQNSISNNNNEINVINSSYLVTTC